MRSFLAHHCLKQCSRCHFRKCGCGWSDIRCGGSARPVLFMIDLTPSGSFVCREINISKLSVKLMRPRSNIQCAVPERAIPLLTISGPFASTGLIWAAATSARPMPLMSFSPVMAHRSSYARKTTRRKTRSRKILDTVRLTRSRCWSNLKGTCSSSNWNERTSSSSRGNKGALSAKPSSIILWKSSAEIGRTAD